MGQLVLFFALQLLGSWVCLAVGPRHIALAIAMGFVSGLAVIVFAGLVLLLTGSFTTAAVIGVILVALAGSIWLAFQRGRATPAIALQLVIWAVAFTALCVPFCVWNTATMTYDSEQFLAYAHQLRTEEQLSLKTLSWLHSWGSFTIVAHALATVTQDDYLYALSPAFSISLLATIGATLYRGLGAEGVSSRARAIAIGGVLLVLLAIPLVRVHVVYVHANWPAAGYLFVFAALFWLAELESDSSYLPHAFLALLAFSLCRVESPLFTALFLVLALSQTRLARRDLLPAYLGFTLALMAWLLLMASVMPADSEYLTPTRSLLMVAALGGLFAMFVVRELRPIRAVLPFVPWIATLSCGVLIALIAATRSAEFGVSFPTWQRNLWTGSYWGYLWWPLCVILGILALRVPAPPHSKWLRYGIGLFFALITVLAGLADFYSSGRYAGLTRLTLHIVPLITFYFALTFVPWVSRRLAKAGTLSS